LYGAAFGAGDAYFRGDDILEGAAEGGLIGAVLGPVTQIKFLGPVLVAGGYAGGIVGVFDALEQDNLQLAAFRALAVYTGLRTFVRPTPEPFTFPPTTGGRLGGGANTGTKSQNCSNFNRSRLDHYRRWWPKTRGIFAAFKRNRDERKQLR